MLAAETMILAHGPMHMQDMIMYGIALMLAVAMPIAALVFVVMKKRSDEAAEAETAALSDGSRVEGAVDQHGVDGDAEDDMLVRSVRGWERP